MGAVLRRELRDTEPRLELSIRFAPLMIFHNVIDHGWSIERVERIPRMVLPSGEVIRGLGSLGRKRACSLIWTLSQGAHAARSLS